MTITRPELFSGDVSIKLEEEEGEGDDDNDVLGLSRDVVSGSVPECDVEVCRCEITVAVEESVLDELWVAERVVKMLVTMISPSLAVDVNTDKSDSD